MPSTATLQRAGAERQSLPAIEVRVHFSLLKVVQVAADGDWPMVIACISLVRQASADPRIVRGTYSF